MEVMEQINSYNAAQAQQNGLKFNMNDKFIHTIPNNFANFNHQNNNVQAPNFLLFRNNASPTQQTQDNTIQQQHSPAGFVTYPYMYNQQSMNLPIKNINQQTNFQQQQQQNVVATKNLVEKLEALTYKENELLKKLKDFVISDYGSGTNNKNLLGIAVDNENRQNASSSTNNINSHSTKLFTAAPHQEQIFEEMKLIQEEKIFTILSLKNSRDNLTSSDSNISSPRSVTPQGSIFTSSGNNKSFTNQLEHLQPLQTTADPSPHHLIQSPPTINEPLIIDKQPIGLIVCNKSIPRISLRVANSISLAACAGISSNQADFWLSTIQTQGGFSVQASLVSASDGSPLTSPRDYKQDILQGRTHLPIENDGTVHFTKLKIVDVSSKITSNNPLQLQFQLYASDRDGKRVPLGSPVRSTPLQVQFKINKRKREGPDSVDYYLPSESQDQNGFSSNNQYIISNSIVMQPQHQQQQSLAHPQPMRKKVARPPSGEINSSFLITSNSPGIMMGSALSPSSSSSSLTSTNGSNTSLTSTTSSLISTNSSNASLTSTNNDNLYVDITDLLSLPQKEAAQKLGISESMLCKRFKECTRRKWPFRYLRKIEKLIATERDSDKVAQLIKEKEECLSPVKIRITNHDKGLFGTTNSNVDEISPRSVSNDGNSSSDESEGDMIVSEEVIETLEMLKRSHTPQPTPQPSPLTSPRQILEKSSSTGTINTPNHHTSHNFGSNTGNGNGNINITIQHQHHHHPTPIQLPPLQYPMLPPSTTVSTTSSNQSTHFPAFFMPSAPSHVTNGLSSPRVPDPSPRYLDDNKSSIMDVVPPSIKIEPSSSNILSPSIQSVFSPPPTQGVSPLMHNSNNSNNTPTSSQYFLH